jgi:PAS domain S-box-containing protein
LLLTCLVFQANATAQFRHTLRAPVFNSNLMLGSISRVPGPGFREAYQQYIVAGVFVVLIQTLVIIGLVWQRAKNRQTGAQLIRYSEKLRMAMELGKSVGWEWDLTSGRDFWFGDLHSMFGVSSETFSGKVSDFIRYVHPEDRKRVSDTVAEARQKRKPYMAEYRILRPDRTIRWIVERGRFEYARDGAPARVLGMAVDITERKQAEEALKSSEEKFSKVFAQSPLAVTLTSIPDLHYLEVNEAFERLTGLRRDEVLGKTPQSIENWVDPTQSDELLKRLIIEGTVRNLDITIRRRDGQIRSALGSCELVLIQGEPCTLSMMSDVTDLKRAEEGERASADRFKRFFDTLPEYCFIISPYGNIMDINPAACSALGYSKEELIGKPLSVIYAPGALTRLIDLSERWKNTGTLHNEEIEVLTKQGQKRTVLVNAGSVRDAHGNLLHTMTVQVDITERKQIQEKLRESQIRLECIIASAMDAIIAIDQKQRIVVFNNAAEKMFECPRSDAIGSSISRFIPERFRAPHAEHIRHFEATGVTNRTAGTEGALWALRANGEEFPIEASISQMEIGNDKLFTVIIRDITGRRRAEERSRELVRRSPIAMLVTEGQEQRNIIMNDRFTSLFGYTLEDVPDAAHWWPLAYPDEAYRNAIRAEWEVRVEEALKNRTEIEPIEATVRCKDGSSRYIEFHFSPLGDANIVSFVDLTEREQAQIVLQESEERFRHVANTAPVMIWMADTDKLCIYVNVRWLQFTGRSFEKELGNGWANGVHPDDLEGCWETYTKAFDRREPFQMEYRVRRYDGEYRWVLDLGVPRLNADGSFAGYIGSCIDVTDQKLAQEALSDMSRKLIEAHEQERTWIARELHDDINQQVALLAVNLERLKQDLPALAPAVIRPFDEIVGHLSDLGTNIQALSHRLHSSKLEYLGIAAAASSFCRELSEKHRVQIDFHSESIPKELRQEIALSLFRILQEGLQNAIKHSGSQSFEVRLGSTSNEIELSVRDTGIGFNPEEAIRGLGLGLTSMRERVKLVHGKFSIDSQPGHGTAIRAIVPLNLGSKAAQA